MTLSRIITTAAALTVAAAFDPYAPGPHPTQHFHISALVTVGLQEELDIWTPTDAGTYPTLYLIDGFGGVIPANIYNELSHHIASHGYSVVAPWSLTLPLNPVNKVPILASVLDWVEEDLEEKLHAKGLDEGVHLDLENIVLSGHSAGAHVLVEYLKQGCGKVKAQVLFSPVDGVDPLGLIPEYCITPGEYLNYGLPTLHLMAGFDNVPSLSGPPCAPDDLSNMRFYEAFDPSVAPLWHLNATLFGHVDLLDDQYVDTAIAAGVCAYNGDLTPQQRDGYRRFAGGSVAAFMAAVFTEDEVECDSYLRYLEDPEVISVQVTSFYDNPSGLCPAPTCTWSALPTTTPAAANTTLVT